MGFSFLAPHSNHSLVDSITDQDKGRDHIMTVMNRQLLAQLLIVKVPFRPCEGASEACDRGSCSAA
jgi:hypothetical protein